MAATEQIPPEIKNFIDTATYTQLLDKWRYASVGDPHFVGAAGVYYAKIMQQRRQEVGHAAHIAASKQIDGDRR